ncbi:hypothetical protein HYS97_00125, partial [Candidatus Daviesbacteria bacterium]|nr:hypothetical protein [Candidatus Daviesbacteria bacterium]
MAGKKDKKPVAEKKQPNYKEFLKILSFALLAAIFLLVFTLLTGWFYFSDKFYPQVSVAGIKLSTLTEDEAYNKLDVKLSERLRSPITLSYESKNYSLDLSGQKQSLKLDEAVAEAFLYGHKKAYFS